MTAAIVIECEFKTSLDEDENYNCNLQGDPLITSPGVTVSSANGDHLRRMSHADVQGFVSHQNTINFMPRGLSDVFPNLIGIWIGFAGMKEIHQSDLKQFPRLRYLSLYVNVLTIIEQDLFKFNPELEYISFYSNKITQIHPTVFDHLNKLRGLHLRPNVCINYNAGDRSAVVYVIRKVKQQCLGDFNIVEEELRPEHTETTSKVVVYRC
jgi:hypothetical protein